MSPKFTHTFLRLDADILFSLQSYDTSNVRCLADRSPEPAPSGCDEALADMPASNKYIAYKQNPPFFAHDIRVPEMILDGRSYPYPPLRSSAQLMGSTN